MTSMYIDFSLESSVGQICLDEFFDGDIRKIKKGEPIGKNARIAEKYEWQLTTAESNYIDTNDILKDFYNQFSKNKKEILNEIRAVKATGYLYVVVNRDSEKDDFSITVSSEMIHFLDELNVEFSIDGIYQ